MKAWKRFQIRSTQNRSWRSNLCIQTEKIWTNESTGKEAKVYPGHLLVNTNESLNAIAETRGRRLYWTFSREHDGKRLFAFLYSLYFATTGLEGLSPVAFKMCLVLKCQLESSVEALILNLFSIILFAKGKINGIKVAVASL